MRVGRLQPFPVLWLTAVWVLLWGNVSWANVISGLVLACIVLLAFPLPRLIVGVRLRPAAFLWLLLRFLWELVIASCIVAWQAVRPGPVVGGRVLTVILRADGELFQTITAGMTALVPGTVVIDLDGHSRVLTLHALDVETDAEVVEVREQVLALEQRVLRALAANTVGEMRVRPRTSLEGE
jgi:multicomponent Na+:H+ antiporter subunit E